MRYFVFCPLDMEKHQAYARAYEHLEYNHIVYVSSNGITVTQLLPGVRPKALPDTHLVRVEQDNSLRIVDSNFT